MLYLVLRRDEAPAGGLVPGIARAYAVVSSAGPTAAGRSGSSPR